MPPRKASKKAGSESDDLSEVKVESEDFSEEEEAPKAKKKAAPRKAPAKKKAPASDDDDSFVDDDDSDAKPKKKKAPAKKTPAKRKAGDDDGEAKKEPKKRVKNIKLEEVTELDDGWVAHPPSLLVRDFGSAHSTKIAAFDFDGTLVVNKSSASFPVSADDWRPYNDTVVEKLKSYQEKGYKLVIFTNQGAIKTALAGAASEKARGRVAGFLQSNKISALCLMATDKDDYRKPSTGMWSFMCDNFMKGEQPDISQSFFVGDSIDGGDEGFAAALGLTFRKHDAEFGALAVASSPNADLVQIFTQLADKAMQDKTDKSAAFKKGALLKVATALSSFPQKIINDPAVLKAVNDLQGVGKSSMETIKEYLTTGKVAKLSGEDLPADKQGAKLTNVARDQALQFM